MSFKNLTSEDISTDTGIVTSGIFQDGSSNISTFFSSSTQYSNTGDYNVDVYRYDPAANASASVNTLFHIATSVITPSKLSPIVISVEQ